METINIVQKRKTSFVSVNNNAISEKKYCSDLEDFLEGTISGEELIKFVCDKLDEKYSQNQSCSI